jgi:hypothetical protein
MMRFWATKFFRTLGMTVLAVILLAANQAFPPASNQLVAWSTICTGITNGTYTALSGTPAQCSSSPNVVVTWANVAGAIKTTAARAATLSRSTHRSTDAARTRLRILSRRST